MTVAPAYLLVVSLADDPARCSDALEPLAIVLSRVEQPEMWDIDGANQVIFLFRSRTAPRRMMDVYLAGPGKHSLIRSMVLADAEHVAIPKGTTGLEGRIEALVGNVQAERFTADRAARRRRP